MSYGEKAFLVSFIMWMIPTVAYAIYIDKWPDRLWGAADCASIGALFWGTVLSLFVSVVFALDESKKGR